MALLRENNKTNIPKNAEIISRDDAFHYQLTELTKWRPRSDVWLLRYGPGSLILLTAGTSIYINNYYRKKLLLGRYGKVATYLPIIFIPSIVSLLLHLQFITKDIMLQDTRCAVCLGTRAMTIQSLFATMYPMTMAPVGAAVIANHYATYRMPYITDVKGIYRFWKKLTKPFSSRIAIIFGIHAIFTMIFTHKEIECYYTWQEKSIQLAKETYENRQ